MKPRAYSALAVSTSSKAPTRPFHQPCHHAGRAPSATLDVRVEGSPAEETVVLLHGFPQGAAAWDRVWPPLAEAGFRVVLPDQRGYSPAARPPARRAYRMAELVGDLVALLDELGVERVHLVGHDWGGAVAWAAAGAHPDRLLSLTWCPRRTRGRWPARC